jgi:drug/metabolite transporter (DMT)-like permease
MPMTLSRSLLTVLIPGLIAVSPWILALVRNTTATHGYGEFAAMGNALVFASAVVAGAICEGIGSHVEHRWDQVRESAYQVKENWYTYLSRNFSNEPVGYRYMSRMVTTMYFELTMMLAVPMFSLGACVLAVFRFPDLAFPLIPSVLLVGVIATAYFHWQAKSTHKVLCITRKELNERMSAS